MAWWTQAGLTTTIAHDALNGGGDRILNRAAANNPLLLNGCSVTEDVAGGFYCIEGRNVELRYNAPVTRPSAGACVALVKPYGSLILQSNLVDNRYLGLFDAVNNQWSMMDGVTVASSVARTAWRCIGIQWSSTQYRIYENNAWLGIARTHSSGANMPPTMQGIVYPSTSYYLSGALAALGVWSGTVTLALLQSIESMMRAELAATHVKSGNAFKGNVLPSSLGPQGAGAGPFNAQALDTGTRIIGVKRIYFNGKSVISGVITVEDVPASRRVRLYLRDSGILMAETWSAADGSYSFSNVDGAYEYFVVAHDHTRTFNAVVQDMLTEVAP